MNEETACCFVHTYTALPGLQAARTVLYCATAVPRGVLLELLERGEAGEERQAALCRGVPLARAEAAMRFLCENAVGPQHWLSVLCDLGLPCEPPAAEAAEQSGEFCSFCRI